MPRLLRPRPASAGRGAGGSFSARLPALGRSIIYEFLTDLLAGRAPQRRRQKVRIMSSRILIQPVTRIEGHAKISIQLDDAGAVQSAQIPRHRIPRIRETVRRPAVSGNAGTDVAGLRHLSGQPRAGKFQGRRHAARRRDSRRPRRNSAGWSTTPRFCNRTRSVSSICPPRICCWAWTRPRRSAISSGCRTG